MATDFGQGVSGLGYLTSAFYLSVAVFQIPGGIFAARYSPKTTSIVGIFLTSTSVVLSGFATQFIQLILLRLLVGTGMAFVFAPGIILITRYYRAGAEGVSIGLSSSAFYLGGAIGIFAWALIAISVGWRLSLLASGLAGIFTAVAIFIFVPSEATFGRFQIKVREVGAVLVDSRLLLLGVGILGATFGNSLMGNFMVYYLTVEMRLWPPLAAVIGSLFLLVPVFSAPIGGRLYDRSKNFRTSLFLSGTGLAVTLMVSGVSGVLGPALAAIAAGFVSGIVFTIAFSAVREMRSGSQYESLSVAWANSLSLIGGFLSPIIFTFFASSFGYPVAWFAGGLSTLALVLTVLMIRETTLTQASHRSI